MQVENVAIEKIIPYAFNNKKHDSTQVDRIANSIKEFGFTQPLVIDKDNSLIIGHGRLEASKKLGLKEVPCVMLDKLTENQVKKLRILDNKLNESDWDLDNLKLDLEDLWDLNIGDLELGIEDLFPELKLNEEEDQEIIEDEEPETSDQAKIVGGGDLFILWPHRLLCGDSTKIEDVELLMDKKAADMVFTDPPYNTGMTEKTAAGSTRLSQFFNDSFTDEERENFMEAFCEQFYAVLKDNSVAYICLDRRRNYQLIPHIKKYFKLSNTIVWDKIVHGLGSDYKYTYELINVCKKWDPKLNTHQWDKEYQDIWHIQRKIGRDKDHATKKPIELCARAIRHGSKKNEIILDLFGGSGSTLIACEQLNRTCYMMELDPRYIETIIKRYHNLNPTAEIKCLNRDIDVNVILE